MKRRSLLPRAVALAAAITLMVVVSGEASARHFTRADWVRAVSAAGLDPEQVVYPFDASDEMKAWAAEQLRDFNTVGTSIQLRALQDALFDREAFSFEYDEQLTLTAEKAFRVRRGNCMSFTALFIALSRSQGIPTKLVSVRRNPDVDKADGLVVVNRHVVAGYQNAAQLNLYDFYVTSSAPYVQHRIVDDVMASAMYHANLGGAAIRATAFDEALRHLRIATTLAPDWGPGWVNLGVARSRLGDLEGALEAYQKALEVDPENPSALTNLAFTFRSIGREDEARTALKAAAEATSNPFTLIAMADVEMNRGNLGRAASYLRRARWWYRDEPEVYDALARLAHLQDDEGKAMRYSRRAAELRTEHRPDYTAAGAQRQKPDQLR